MSSPQLILGYLKRIYPKCPVAGRVAGRSRGGRGEGVVQALAVVVIQASTRASSSQKS
jgi:hypothetical protein